MLLPANSPPHTAVGASMRTHPSTVRNAILIFLALTLVSCRSHKSATPSPTHTTNTASIIAPEPTPTPTPLPVVLENGWYLYTDPDGEFSFAYPSTAVITTGKNPVDLSKNITIQFQDPGKAYQGMSIRLELNPKRLQGAEIAKQLYEVNAQKPAAAEFTDALKQMLVGGAPAVQASIPSTNTELTIIIPYNDKVFIISPVHDLSWTKVEPETLDLFYQVVNTLKLGISK
jgi:hypothetical protein